MTSKSIKRVRRVSWTTVVDTRFRVSIPPGAIDWKIGRRVFWRTMTERPGTAVVSSSPHGSVREGRYLSSRLQRIFVSSKAKPRIRKLKPTSVLKVKGLPPIGKGTPLFIDDMRP